MPFGLTWPAYIRFVTAASFSMFLGSQVVHNFYKPLEDLDELVQAEVKKIEEERKKRQYIEKQLSNEKDKYNLSS